MEFQYKLNTDPTLITKTLIDSRQRLLQGVQRQNQKLEQLEKQRTEENMYQLQLEIKQLKHKMTLLEIN
jgi:hypothetical protein